MSKEKKNTQNEKRKLSRQERKQIDTLIRQAKGDGKPHTAQDSIPFERMYKDGICRLANGRYSKCIEFEDINYQLAQPDDKTAIFEALCDMYNSFDASISVQLSLISRHAKCCMESPRQGNAENDPRRGGCGKPHDGRNNEYQRKAAGGKLFPSPYRSGRKGC